MNRPSKHDDGNKHPGWNQMPPFLAGGTTTRSDLNGIANIRTLRNHRIEDIDPSAIDLESIQPAPDDDSHGHAKPASRITSGALATMESHVSSDAASISSHDTPKRHTTILGRSGKVLGKYAKFIGPGVMVSVAYIDPGNYATDVAAGASYRFKLLFIVLVSNIFAIFLQTLCIKLGSVTGMNLAQMCKAHTPKWLNYILYIFAEAAIIATDIAEVIGTAIALNLLFKIPLVAGCAISILDVLIILFFYRPSGTVRAVRIFELFVMVLVLGVVICFCFQLSLIKDTSVGEVFRGYLPSSAIVQSKGLYQSCGILGATVMPHSLYLGSGMVQPRLLEYDTKHHNVPTPTTSSSSDPVKDYKPSISAIRSCMKYSIVELSVALFTFALFVNSAILIVAGASLSDTPDAASASLFGIHDLLSSQLSKAAGVVFALALLLSGTSAGIICTIAGQMVSEGQLSWSVKPWVRRLMTRSISITPSIIIAGAVGANGLTSALEATQVALSIILPVVSAPLIYFTCRDKYMTVAVSSPGTVNEGVVRADIEGTSATQPQGVKMGNHWVTAVCAITIWLIIVLMNGAAIVLLGLGEGN